MILDEKQQGEMNQFCIPTNICRMIRFVLIDRKEFTGSVFQEELYGFSHAVLCEFVRMSLLLCTE